MITTNPSPPPPPRPYCPPFSPQGPRHRQRSVWHISSALHRRRGPPPVFDAELEGPGRSHPPVTGTGS